MNLWADNKEGRPVNDCRIIEMLRALDCNVSSLIFFSRELAAMHSRMVKIIEALYKWDMKDNTCIPEADFRKVANDSFLEATTASQRSAMSREDIKSIMKKYGFDIKGEITPLEIHIATEPPETKPKKQRTKA